MRDAVCLLSNISVNDFDIKWQKMKIIQTGSMVDVYAYMKNDKERFLPLAKEIVHVTLAQVFSYMEYLEKNPQEFDVGLLKSVLKKSKLCT